MVADGWLGPELVPTPLFSLMAGLIAEVLFMLLSVFDVVGWVKNQ